MESAERRLVRQETVRLLRRLHAFGVVVRGRRPHRRTRRCPRTRLADDCQADEDTFSARRAQPMVNIGR